MLRLLLPALMPSWRFFDRVGPSPRVEYATHADARDTPLRWREVYPPPRHLTLLELLWRLVWNPAGNERLYLVSCAERLLEDRSPDRAGQLVSRVAMLLEKSAESDGLRVRVVLVTGAAGDAGREVVFDSGAQGGQVPQAGPAS